jgi:hypothetical protein
MILNQFNFIQTQNIKKTFDVDAALPNF